MRFWNPLHPLPGHPAVSSASKVDCLSFPLDITGIHPRSINSVIHFLFHVSASNLIGRLSALQVVEDLLAVSPIIMASTGSLSPARATSFLSHGSSSVDSGYCSSESPGSTVYTPADAGRWILDPVRIT